MAGHAEKTIEADGSDCDRGRSTSESVDNAGSLVREANLTFLIGETKPTGARHGISSGFFNPRMGSGRDLSTLLLRALLAGHGGALPGGGDCESQASVERLVERFDIEPFP